MMGNEVFLHIGTHKTGTSSIQSNLPYAFSTDSKDIFLPDVFYKSQFLEERFPLCHPLVACFCPTDSYEYIINHIPEFLSQKKFKDLLFKRAEEELRQLENKKIIITHERLFFELSDDKIKELTNFLYKFSSNINVVVYIRNPYDFLRSWLNQDVKNGAKKLMSSKQLLEKFGDFAFYYKPLKKWSSALKDKANFTVKLFDHDYLLNRSVVDDFFSFAKLKFNNDYVVMDDNLSLNTKETELLLHLNAFLPNKDNPLERNLALEPLYNYFKSHRIRNDHLSEKLKINFDSQFCLELQKDIKKWSFEFFGKNEAIYDENT